MKILNYSFLLMISASLLQACSSPYYGYTKNEWDSLTDEQRTIVKEEYQAVITARNNQSHTDKLDERTQSIIEFGVNRQFKY